MLTSPTSYLSANCMHAISRKRIQARSQDRAARRSPCAHSCPSSRRQPPAPPLCRNRSAALITRSPSSWALPPHGIRALVSAHVRRLTASEHPASARFKRPLEGSSRIRTSALRLAQLHSCADAPHRSSGATYTAVLGTHGAPLQLAGRSADVLICPP